MLKSSESLGLYSASIGNKKIDWDEFINQSSAVKLVFKSNVDWLNQYKSSLIGLISRGGTLEVVLPNPDDPSTVEQLGRQRKKSATVIKESINEAARILREIKGNSEKLKIHITNIPFLSHYYIFDKISIVTIRSYTLSESPHLICGNKSADNNRLYRYCTEQFDALKKTSVQGI